MYEFETILQPVRIAVPVAVRVPVVVQPSGLAGSSTDTVALVRGCTASALRSLVANQPCSAASVRPRAGPFLGWIAYQPCSLNVPLAPVAPRPISSARALSLNITLVTHHTDGMIGVCLLQLEVTLQVHSDVVLGSRGPGRPTRSSTQICSDPTHWHWLA